METPPSCPICFEGFLEDDAKNNNNKCIPCSRNLKKINQSKINLDCGHSFHHDCLVDWLMTKDKKPYYLYAQSYKLFCPYCRKKFNYVPLPENLFPIRNIHQEYNIIQTFIDNKDKVSLNEVCPKMFNQNHCNTILKTGKNRGYQCSRQKINGSEMCKLHSNKYKSIADSFM